MDKDWRTYSASLYFDRGQITKHFITLLSIFMLFQEKNTYLCNWRHLYSIEGNRKKKVMLCHSILISRFILIDLGCGGGAVVSVVKLLSESLMLPPSLQKDSKRFILFNFEKTNKQQWKSSQLCSKYGASCHMPHSMYSCFWS